MNILWSSEIAPDIDPRIANGDPHCDVCGSFNVESKKEIGFMRGKSHREENSVMIYFYECECGAEWD